MARQNTRETILAIAQEMLNEEGLDQVSFDGIARRLGRSKQAVLYWFPSRQDLLAAMFLPALTAEAEAVETALHETTGRAQAVKAFVKAMKVFHAGNLPRFRMMYLAPQISRAAATRQTQADVLEQIHAVTDRTYAALATKLDRAPDLARQEAVAIHAAVLGLLTMLGLADHLEDPLKHGQDRLFDALIQSFNSP